VDVQVALGKAAEGTTTPSASTSHLHIIINLNLNLNPVFPLLHAPDSSMLRIPSLLRIVAKHDEATQRRAEEGSYYVHITPY